MYRESELQKQLVRIKPLLQTSLLVIMAYCQITYVQAATTDNSACYNNRDGEIIYVDASSKGVADGRSWSTAFRSLQNALNHAQAMAGKKQMWVASGRYISEKDGFSIPSNVHLYGGFNGKETAFKKRSHTNNVTVLSGNNVAHHVVNVAQATNVVLDGFIIRRGNATGDLNADEADSSNEVRGGGVYSVDSDLSICNSMFIRNRAKKFGGAIFQQGGKLRITKSRFLHNTVLRGVGEVHDTDAEADTDGGAIAIHEAEEFRIEHSVFADNIAGDDAGAIASRKTNVDIKNSRFVRNKGISLAIPPNTGQVDELLTAMGGAIQVWNDYIGFNNGDQSFTTTISKSTFISNKSSIASAVYIQSPPGSISKLSQNRFLNNGGNGQPNVNAPRNEMGVRFGRGVGALLLVGLRLGDRETNASGGFMRPLHKATILDSYFSKNYSGYGAGLGLIGMLCNLNQSIFINNTARQRGGAIWSHNFLGLFDQFAGFSPDDGALKVNNSLFYKNKALGKLETLQHDTFPMFVSISEQTYGGGAIHNEIGNKLRVSNSFFINNSSKNSDGGAINNVSASVEFFGNLSESSLGSYSASLRVSDSWFYNNKAINGSGGAISSGAGQSNGRVLNASGNSAAADVSSSQLEVYSSVFRGNSSSGFGGALANWNNSVSKVSNNKFIMNSSGDGGAISSIGSTHNSANLRVNKSRIFQNVANNGLGGGISAINSLTEINSTTFNKNTPQNINW